MTASFTPIQQQQQQPRALQRHQDVALSEGSCAYVFEQEILRRHQAQRYRGPKLLCGTGNEELFVCDVLSLDRNQK